jgi:hypothetical protein
MINIINPLPEEDALELVVFVVVLVVVLVLVLDDAL